jgi:hypothetical protein
MFLRFSGVRSCEQASYLHGRCSRGVTSFPDGLLCWVVAGDWKCTEGERREELLWVSCFGVLLSPASEIWVGASDIVGDLFGDNRLR